MEKLLSWYNLLKINGLNMDRKMPQDTLSFLQRLQEYGLWGYAWLLFISLLGGTVRYLTSASGTPFSIKAWIKELVISGFVGVITIMICQYYQLDFMLTGAITGIASHNGTRSIYLIAEIIKKKMTIIEELEPTKSPKVLAKREDKQNADLN